MTKQEKISEANLFLQTIADDIGHYAAEKFNIHQIPLKYGIAIMVQILGNIVASNVETKIKKDPSKLMLKIVKEMFNFAGIEKTNFKVKKNED